MHTKLKMRRNHGLETTSEPINTHRSTTSVIISFKGKRIFKRTLIQMRPELQQEYKKHQNQGGIRNHYFFGRGNRKTSEAGSPQDSSGGCGSGRDDQLFGSTRWRGVRARGLVDQPKQSRT